MCFSDSQLAPSGDGLPSRIESELTERGSKYHAPKYPSWSSTAAAVDFHLKLVMRLSDSAVDDHMGQNKACYHRQQVGHK